MADVTIYVPDIGGAEGAEVVEVLVAVGDTVELEQSLIVLESDKASMEIPATESGTIVELKVAVGDQLSEGDAILVLKSEATTAVESPAEPEPDDEKPSTDSPAPTSAESEQPSSVSPVEAMTVVIPDIGTDGDVELIEVLVEPGQAVSEGDSLVVLESDKASMEVPAPADGTVSELLVAAGATVREGSAILTLMTAASGQASSAAASPSAPQAARSESAASTAQPASMPSASPQQAAPAVEAPARADAGSVYAGPAVRKLAREFGIDLTQVTGSGPRGRVVKEDLHAYVQKALADKGSASQPAVGGSGIPAIPEVDFSKFGPIDPQPRTRLDKVTAANMSRAWLNVPHVTQFDDADITDLESFRASMKAEAERRGAKLTPMPFIIKAVAVALNAHPKLKTSLADGGETLVYKQYCHIGMAVDTPAGLVVPVIRDVDKKSVWELSAEILELAGLARDKKLRPDQMQGGVFSVSSLGNIGGRGFTPIVNAPEVAILGVSRADTQPVWNGSEFVPRKMLPLSLSYDHRVINGGDAGRFLTDLSGLLSDIRRILL